MESFHTYLLVITIVDVCMRALHRTCSSINSRGTRRTANLSGLITMTTSLLAPWLGCTGAHTHELRQPRSSTVLLPPKKVCG